jgi:hypothetical protein
MIHEKNAYFLVRSDLEVMNLNFNKTTYIGRFSDYLKSHIGAKTVVTREALISIEAKLPQADF